MGNSRLKLLKPMAPELDLANGRFLSSDFSKSIFNQIWKLDLQFEEQGLLEIFLWL